MKRGAWHQCGFNSQKLVLELLQSDVGVGAIISPKDLGIDNAANYSSDFRDAGADVLLDPQFYEPQFRAGKLESYPTANFRQSIRTLGGLQAGAVTELTKAIEQENRALHTAAVIAPAVPYEAARPDIVALNARLFEAAKAAGNAIGIPTYATVVLGHSATAGAVAQNILSGATALPADGWYYGFEFGAERLPTDLDAVYRYCAAGLTLACTGKPVLHACAGPMALISFGSGARAAALGFWQNLWGFQRSRWQTTEEQGGGGSAPPRFFSVPLWGTIVYPDETVRLPASVRAQVMRQSPHSSPTISSLTWKKWDSFKHQVHMIARAVQPNAELRDARKAMNAAVKTLTGAQALHSEIRKKIGAELKDNTAAYQPVWTKAANDMLSKNSDDFDYLEMVGGP